jgi:hypothetical protein
MNWLLWIAALLSIGAPSVILMLDRGKDIPASTLIKKLGIPAFVLFLIVLAYSAVAKNPLLSLLVWGAVGGLLASVALDAVRLTGVKLGAFPLDMPVMFGLMALGAAPKLPKNVMARMVAMLSELAPEERRKMMEPRIKAISQLPPEERKLFMSMMLNGLNRLPEEKRQNVFRTNTELISSLPPEQRAAMMETMDQLFITVQSDSNVHHSAPISLMAIFREGKMPKLPMSIGRELLGKAIPDTLHEHGTTLGKARLAFTLLFGMGSIALVVAWVTFIDLVMMVSMPPMMPMIRLPFPRFLVVPYFAHLAMAVPIGFFALTYITPSATISSSLIGSVLFSTANTTMSLIVGPIIAFVVLSAIIWLGYKFYTKPIYGKGWQ